MTWAHVSLALSAAQVILTGWLVWSCVKVRRLHKLAKRSIERAEGYLAQCREHEAMLEGFARAMRAGAILPIVVRPAEDDDEDDKRGPLH